MKSKYCNNCKYWMQSYSLPLEGMCEITQDRVYSTYICNKFRLHKTAFEKFEEFKKQFDWGEEKEGEDDQA